MSCVFPWTSVFPTCWCNFSVFQNILYEIIAGLRNVSADAPSSSAAPRSISSTKSVGELLSDIAPVCNVNYSSLASSVDLSLDIRSIHVYQASDFLDVNVNLCQDIKSLHFQFYMVIAGCFDFWGSWSQRQYHITSSGTCICTCSSEASLLLATFPNPKLMNFHLLGQANRPKWRVLLLHKLQQRKLGKMLVSGQRWSTIYGDEHQ